MLPKALVHFVAFATVAAHPPHTPGESKGPIAHVKNGTLRGFDLPNVEQELFLGVPFAQPPGLTFGEDCLTLDIVRPKQTGKHDKLPVFVWIYGGGFQAGSTADPRYNTSYIVNASVAINKPIIAVALNYRVGGWGIVASKEMLNDGALNIGLYDRRLALKWIHENIAAFGGDPDAVTIGGESAGAFSVRYHLVGFDGQNEGLFRAAIMQSGTAIARPINAISDLPTTYQPIYDNVTEAVGCSNTTTSLACLRKLPYDDLFEAFATAVMTPVLDGDFLRHLPSQSYEQDLIADVAIPVGSNTDKGTPTFFGPRGTLNTDADFESFLSAQGYGLNTSTVQRLAELYPDHPEKGCPFNTGSERFERLGYQYKRGAAVVGDMVIISGTRATAQYHSSRFPTYSYQFDQSPWNGIMELVATEAPVYATLYAEICYVFNIEPSASVNNTNWIGPYPEYYEFSNLMSRAWISFVHDLDPNHDCEMPEWPAYEFGKQNMVFKVGDTHVEKDGWRVEQLEFWKTIYSTLAT
ncbi:alpha/beta-hydrolase [Setomelanomma holmii]|uniref:Carboxylic ester hydrolase n=1 Tax=Setomelanomma holmii TaxID=210430 RepID=A0A9P4HDB2_9PLEO|nr:alpha/beta-hydrolase [Setomelanomma holmii]